jgi:small-conductance mechanosensitive channel
VRLGIPTEVRLKIMEVLDTDNAGVLRREQIVRRFVEIYERRRDLAKSLASTTSVLATLERIILSALYFLLVFVVLGIFEQNIVEMWFTASSMLLAFVFMFGNSIKQLFESVIFIFVIHPFDVGDAVLIDNERHAVRNIGILTTETVKWNGQVIYYPNASMSTKPLVNLTRMKKFTDEQTWVVDIATPSHVFEALPMYFHKWADDHPDDFHEITPRIYSHQADPLKIKITLYYEYTFNGLPPTRAGNARDLLGLAMRKFLLDNDVAYRQQTLPVEIVQGGGSGLGLGLNPVREQSRGRSPARGASRRSSVTLGSGQADKPSVFLDLAVKQTTTPGGSQQRDVAGGERMVSRDDTSLARASG